MTLYSEIRIEKKDWLESQFAISSEEIPLLRSPVANFQELPFEAKDKLLQVYVTKAETIQVLGAHETFYLVKKRDGVLGWIPKRFVVIDEKIKKFPEVFSKLQKASDFLAEWVGVAYRWGGVSKSGIDCSGFTQTYFMDVLNTEIPKNSQDQKKLGSSIVITEIKDHDLIFCHRKGPAPVNHVGVFYRGKVYHAQLNRGVVSDSLDDFVDRHVIQDIKRISPRVTKNRSTGIQVP